MSQRRMFSPSIIDTDNFLDMGVGARELYFQLGMRADDDGFVGNPQKIIRMIGATTDDLKVLMAKNFIIPFDSGVLVVTHWKVNNLVRKDWYRETQYKEEKRQLIEGENHEYKKLVNESLTNRQHRLGKVRLGKVRLNTISSSKKIPIRESDKQRLKEIKTADQLPDDPDCIKENKKERQKQVDNAKKSRRPTSWVYDLLMRMKKEISAGSVSMRADASAKALAELRKDIEEQEGKQETNTLKERIWKSYLHLLDRWNQEKYGRPTFVTLRRYWVEHDVKQIKKVTKYKNLENYDG
jgi:hypothetical protein